MENTLDELRNTVGRDYSRLAHGDLVRCRIGDGAGFPFKGPLRVKYLDNGNIAVIEKQKGISFVKENASESETIQQTQTHGFISCNTFWSSAVSFLAVDALDICLVPLSSNIAMSDAGSHQIVFFEKRELYIKKQMPGRQMGVVSMSAFRIGYEVYFILANNIQRNVAIVKEGGQEVCSTSGDSKNVFDSITSMSAWLHSSELNQDIPQPIWYVGKCSLAELVKMLPESSEPGSFLVGKDINISGLFHIVYIDSLWRREVATITCTTTGEYLLATKDTTMVQSSVHAIIRAWDMLIKPINESRKFIYIAVSDIDSKCVQILQYFWWSNEIYKPEILYYCTIGGVRKGCGYRFQQPISVSYCNTTGDLAVCDTGKHSVCVFNTNLNIICELKVHFSPDWRQFENPYSMHNITTDQCPETVTFSNDRSLCVAYQQGGIIVHKPYDIFAVGNFTDTPINSFKTILKFLDYSSIEQLRNSCRRFHNITREMRRDWRLPPLSPERYSDMLFQYIKWARSDTGLPFNTGVAYLADSKGNKLCMSKLNKTCANLLCTESHENLLIDLNIIHRKGSSFLMLDQFHIAISDVFGSKFLWKNKIFVDEYFLNYGENRIIICREDPMSWKNETLRVEIKKEVRVITFWSYVFFMTMAEECFTNSKHFSDQRTFKLYKRPSAAVPTEYLGQLRGITESVFVDDSSRPYSHRINISTSKSKIPLVKTIQSAAELQRKATSFPPSLAHVKYCEMQVDHCIDLIDNLF